MQEVFLGGKGILKVIYTTLSCLLMLYAHILHPEYEAIVSIAVILLGVVFGMELSICMYLCATVIQIVFSDLEERLLLVLIGCVLLIAIARYRIYRKDWLLKISVAFWLCSLLSTVFGYNSSITANIIILFQLLLMVVVSYYCKKESNVIFAGLIISGLCLCLYVFYMYLTGNAVYFGVSLAYGDGEKAGQIKALSTCVAIPAYYFLYNMVYTNRILLYRLMYLLLFSICAIVIILTYSRAVLLAIGLVLVFILLYFSKDRFSLRKFLVTCFVASALVVGVYYFVGNIELNQDKMLSNLDTGNGRTEIWAYFISKMNDGGLPRFLLGFGPGDSKRITEGSLFSGYYAHSVILDYLFSFGIIGFSFICFLIFKTIRLLYKEKNVFYFGLLLLNSVMFFSHGTSTNYLFHTILAICIGASIRKKVFVINLNYQQKK